MDHMVEKSKVEEHCNGLGLYDSGIILVHLERKGTLKYLDR